MNIFEISDCNIAQTVGETSRFIFHILLLNFCTVMIDDSEEFFTAKIYKTIFATAMAVICYHLFVRKLVEPSLEKMKSICKTDNTNRLKLVA